MAILIYGFSWKLAVLWMSGFLFRYFALLPIRGCFFAVGMVCLVLSTALIGILPDSPLKRNLNEKCMLMCFRVISRSFPALVYFHDEENKAKGGGICVANHTSPIDVMVLG